MKLRLLPVYPSKCFRRCCFKAFRSDLHPLQLHRGTDGTLCAPAAPSTYSTRAHTHLHTLILSHTCAGVRAHTHFKCLTNAIPGTAFPKEYQSIDSWKIWSGGPNKDNEAALVSLNNFILWVASSKRCYRVRETVKAVKRSFRAAVV